MPDRYFVFTCCSPTSASTISASANWKSPWQRGCVAVCCPLLLYVAPCCPRLPYVALCCPRLPYAALCCSIKPYVALCCPSLPYDAPCCTMLPSTSFPGSFPRPLSQGKGPGNEVAQAQEKGKKMILVLCA